MILVADSGSTKTAWAVIGKEGVVANLQSAGINPIFRSTNDIINEIEPLLQEFAGKIRAVHFFGAGVINEDKAAVVGRALSAVLGNVRLEVQSDMLGAAKALCADEPGVVCILGTGSNACVYDGERLGQNTPPMGFILGDEASGAVMGKQLLGDYFKGLMPADVEAAFGAAYGLQKDEVIERVYRTERPNLYLAQFAPFLSEFVHPYCANLVAEQFASFLRRNVLQLPGATSMPINFVGSVALHFETQLTEQLAALGLQKGRLLQSPIEGLVRFYLKKLAL